MTDRAGPDPTRRFYDRISLTYDTLADASERVIRDIGIKALAVTPGERALEIGCGTGHGLVEMAVATGEAGFVHGVDVSSGMISVARSRVRSAGLSHVSLSIADARALCFSGRAFDAVFMSFTLELFETEIPAVLAEVRRVLRVGGRLGVVAMADLGHTNPAVDLYRWLHRRWPNIVDCSPIDVIGVLERAGFDAATVETTAIWGLPVTAVVGVNQRPA